MSAHRAEAPDCEEIKPNPTFQLSQLVKAPSLASAQRHPFVSLAVFLAMFSVGPPSGQM